MPAAASASTTSAEAQITEAPAAPAAPAAKDAAGSGSLWGLIIEAILWGFAALLTPCVFPMVPMTVSYFLKGEGGAAMGRLRASLYGLFIVLLYTVPIAAIILITRIVGGDAVTADIFNWLATHWLPNILFFLVFMVFAASFFGAFEITMPSWMVNKTDSKADTKGIGGIFFLALTLVLVSFSCTGPIVGSVLIKSTSGEFWTPILTMLAFSVAFALPFPKTAVFAVSYLFSMVAILAQIYVIRAAFCQGEGVKSKFYGFPIARIGLIYLAAQVVLGFLFMALGLLFPLPLWLPLALYVVLLGAAAVGLVAADAAREEVVRQEVRAVKDVSLMRGLQAAVSALAGRCEDPALRRGVQDLAENLRFSDPVSSEALASAEAALSACVARLQQAVEDRRQEEALALCREADRILADRNQLCRLSKAR